MTDPTRHPDTADDTGVAPARASTTGTPVWVWLVGIVVLGTSLAMIVSMFVLPLLMGGFGGGGN